EFDRSFLHLHPWAAAVTTTDEDHLDIYGDSGALLETFDAFVGQVSGPTFTATDLQHTTRVGSDGSHCWASDIRPNQGAYHFTLHLGGEQHTTSLQMPGRHNIYNAVLAASLAHGAGASPAQIAAALPSFQGIKRRFEFHLHRPVVLIEDYAHHPTELEALLDSIDELYPTGKVTIVFQPHLFSRTR
ncbi:MAG: UDP-N-acetylmuramate--L-alanine ligase, partial [Propionibacteriaceae bacterium]|nr:UDP-N-acetylmuramate--L-alanine ligase [Propionibacteriaceae bacterium]